MNRHQAARFLEASGNDAVLAAWVASIWPIWISTTNDISPYDAWDKYQTFYNLGLVSNEQYNACDRKLFFASRLSWDSFQRVHHNLEQIENQPLPMEPPVTKKHELGNMFADATSLVPSESGALTGGRATPSLSTRPTSPGLSPFASDREVFAPRMDPAPFQMEAPRGTDRSRGSFSNPQLGPQDIQLQLNCCGYQVSLMDDGGEMVAPDELPGGSVPVFDAVFHGRCEHCGTILHVSAGKPMIPDNSR
jgi:hypothetical protein